MVDDSSQVFTWLESHFGLLAAVFGWAASAFGFVFATKQARKDLDALCLRVDDGEDRFSKHEADYRRHIDPERDENRWRELYKRLDRIERQLGQRPNR